MTQGWSSPRGATLLLLCEDPDETVALREQLEEDGFRVVAAPDDATARAIQRGLAVDAVVRLGNVECSDVIDDEDAAPVIEDEGGPGAGARIADSVRLRLSVERCAEQEAYAQA